LISLALVTVLSLAAGRLPEGWFAFDRQLHFIGFAVVGILAVLALRGWISFLALFGVIALGVLTEAFQNSVLARTPDPIDLIANVAGAMTGALLAQAGLGVAAWRRHRRQRAEDQRRQVPVSAGNVLFWEGDRSQDLYIVLEGEMEMVKDNDGTEVVLGTCGPREVFGEMACIQSRPRYATARARTDAIVYSLSPDELMGAVGTVDFPLLAILRNLVDRLRQQNDRLTELAAEIAETGPARASQGAGITLHPDSLLLKTIMPAELRIDRLPYTVGRRRREREAELTGVDLPIDDRAPYRLSRRHFTIKRLGTRFVVVDDASKLGTRVNGATIGPFERATSAELSPGANAIVAGGEDSPYVFRIEINRAAPGGPETAVAGRAAG
jgi:CRP-like cAMP-binding protein